MGIEKLVYIGNAKQIPIGESKNFLYPSNDKSGTSRPGLLIHLEDGFYAYEGLCTHMKAEVKWNKYTGKIWCTMHDGMYNPKTGYRFMGMPEKPLPKISLKVESNGDIYVIL
jgi:nitrite reductase/ring-hydroxylating ferredoxin subunit